MSRSIGVGLLLYAAAVLGCWALQSLPLGTAFLSPAGSGPVLGSASLQTVGLAQQEIERPALSVRRWRTLRRDGEFELVDLDGRGADILSVDIDGAWTTICRMDASLADSDANQQRWSTRLPSEIESTRIWPCEPITAFQSKRTLLPKLLHSTPDLDSDGTADLVWYSPERAASVLLAVSGSTGKQIWMAKGPAGQTTRILPEPSVVDVNRDTCPDIVTCFQGRDGSVWLEAIDGSNGQRIWTQTLANGISNKALRRTNFTTPLEPRLIGARDIGGQVRIVIEDDQQIGFRSIETGQPTGSVIAPQGKRIQPTYFHDLDGDGVAEAISSRQHDTRDLVAGLPPGCVSIWNQTDNRSLWDRRASVRSSGRDDAFSQASITDVDRNGRSEFLVNRFRGSCVAVNLVDALTGLPAWPEAHRISRNPRSSVEQFLEHPDTDGDGVNEVIVVSLDESKRHQPQLATYIDLLSGKTGQPLKSMSRPLAVHGSEELITTKWLHAGNARCYLLVVVAKTATRGIRERSNSLSIDVWDPAHGKLVGCVNDIDQFKLSELDENGRNHLFVTRKGIRNSALCVVNFESQQESSLLARVLRVDRDNLSASFVDLPQSNFLSAEADPRWLEPLPWVTFIDRLEQGMSDDVAQPLILRLQYIGLAQVAFLGIFLAPCWLVFSSLSQGQWSLVRWLLLPAAIGVAIATASFFAANGRTEEIAKVSGLPVLIVAMLVPLMSSTLLLLPIEVAFLLLQRHFRSIGVLFLVITLVAAFLSSIWMLVTWNHMHPDVSFASEGWYWVWLWTAYVTGWAYMASVAIYHVSHRLEHGSMLPRP